MEVLAVIDLIPGIMDRGPFRDSLKKAIATEETLSLALMDADSFMELNELQGEEAGDRLLLLLGAVLSANAQAYGWQVGRIGGDEFALFLPGVTLERAFLAMEALRAELVQKMNGPFDPIKPTFSIGVVNCPRDAKDVSGLFRQAENALFQAKEAGRNQVALPAKEEMVLRSCYYTTTQLARLKKLAEQAKKKESVLLREALDDLLRKYDVK